VSGNDPETGVRPPSLPRVIAGALVLVCLMGWLLGLGTRRPAGLPPPAAFLLAYRLVVFVGWPLVVSAAIFIAAASAGAGLLRLLGRDAGPPLQHLLFAVALGLGVSAYGTLALGAAGILHPGALWGLTAVMLIVGWPQLAPLLARLVRDGREWVRSWDRFECALTSAGVALVLVGLFCAPTPIMDYDTLEYHLGAPGEYFAAGRVRFLPHNVYASFPAHVETLYLLGIVLGGGKGAGMAVAVLLQVGFGLLAAGAAGAVAGRFVSRRAALPAAVFFLSCPLFIVTVVRAHITLARCLYIGVALLAVLEWVYGEEERRRTRLLAIGGLCCGLAVAVKYTALLMVCLPLGASVLAVSLLRPEPLWRRLGPPLVLAGCALLGVLPWLLKNVVATGNPFFPLLYGVFGGCGWAPEQAAKFAFAHAVPPVRSVGQLPVEVWRFLTGYVDPMSAGFAGPLAVAFIPLLLRPFALRRPRAGGGKEARAMAPVAFLFGYVVVMVLLWAVATHRIARFLAPSLVVLATLSAAGFTVAQHQRWARIASRALALALVMFAVCYHARRQGMPYLYAVEWVNDPANVPPEGVLMLVGEARAYYFDRQVLYSTVFNDHPIEPALRQARSDRAAAVKALRSTGATHVLVNWSELRRLSETYSFPWRGHRRPGYLPEVDLASRQPLLELLEAAGTRVQAYGSMRWPNKDSPDAIPVIEVYALR